MLYANEEDDQIELWGLQTNLSVKDLNLPLNTSFDLMFNYVQGKETNILAPLVGRDTAAFSFIFDDLAGFPSFMAQFNLTFELLDEIKLKLFNTFNTQTLAIGEYLNKPLREFVYSESFYRLNFQINYQLNNNLTLRARVNNVFDKDYAGIDATDQVENLLYNPQPSRNFFISLNYNFQ